MFLRIQTAFKKITVSQWVLVVLCLLAFGTSMGSWFITPPDGRNPDWWTSWLQNFSTEMFGAISTFILFELIIGRSEKTQVRIEEIQRRKADMIRRLRSGDLGNAKVALVEARDNGWLQDGTLADADLEDANLEGMNLKGANLAHVTLERANLSKANLERANLSKANLSEANLSEANLSEANLDEAYLNKANLRGANLSKANVISTNLEGANLTHVNLKESWLVASDLEGADLKQANLSYTYLESAWLMKTCLEDANLEGAELGEARLWGANLNGAIFKHATLPDRTTWTTQTDMGRFTDKTHPHFFCSEDDLDMLKWFYSNN